MATAKIQILSDGPMRGTSFSLTNESYSIGRSESCDICIPDGTISGHHCTLLQDSEGGYVLRDEGSTNGTRNNSQKVEAGMEVALNNGDIFQLGGIELLYDSGEGVRLESARPSGVINLDEGHTETVTTSMQNMGVKAGGKKKAMMRENRAHKIFFNVVLVILALTVLGCLGKFAMDIFGNK